MFMDIDLNKGNKESVPAEIFECLVKVFDAIGFGNNSHPSCLGGA